LPEAASRVMLPVVSPRSTLKYSLAIVLVFSWACQTINLVATSVLQSVILLDILVSE
jgi:hypothetical protein